MPSYSISLFTGAVGSGFGTDATVRISFSTQGVSLGIASFPGDGLRLEGSWTNYRLNSRTFLTHLDELTLRLANNSTDNWFCDRVQISGEGINKLCIVGEWVTANRINKPVVNLLEAGELRTIEMVDDDPE